MQRRRDNRVVGCGEMKEGVVRWWRVWKGEERFVVW